MTVAATDTARRGARWAALALLFVPLLAWLGVQAARETAANTLQRAAAAVAVQSVDQALPAGTPGFALEGPDDQATPIAPLGRLLAGDGVVLLNFWASWCPPCLEEMPSWLRLAAQAKGLGVSLVAVSYDDDWAAQRKVLGGGALPGGVAWLRDPAGQDGVVATSLRGRFGTDKLPETWVLRGGRVVGRFVGAQRWDGPEMLRYLGALAQRR